MLPKIEQLIYFIIVNYYNNNRNTLYIFLVFNWLCLNFAIFVKLKNYFSKYYKKYFEKLKNYSYLYNIYSYLLLFFDFHFCLLLLFIFLCYFFYKVQIYIFDSCFYFYKKYLYKYIDLFILILIINNIVDIIIYSIVLPIRILFVVCELYYNVIVLYSFELYTKFKNQSLTLLEMFVFQFILCLFILYFFLAYKLSFILKLFCLFALAIFHISCLKSSSFNLIKFWGLFWSIIIFLSMLLLIVLITVGSGKAYANEFYFFAYSFKFFGSKVIYGIDMISLLFVLLTGFLFIIVFLSLFSVEMLELKIYYLVIYLLYFILVNIFITQNLIWFFAFFESSVFPMFIIILMGGSRVQKFKAAYYFFFFTVIGSIFMFISINYIFFRLGTVNICELMFVMHELSIFEQRLIWLSFFLSFAIKVPMFPFHTWLPEAHVEAPTIGSVLLAGILLKLGIYGFIRVSFFLLPEANVFFSTYVYILALISIFYSCIIAIRQTDIKRIIAYASIAHMNLIILGLFSFSSVGIYGAIFQSISHGLVSSALFLLVGMLYSRYKSRIINYYSGLTQVMPIFSFFFLLFTLANISFPLTSNFMGELLLFVGISKLSLGILILSLFGIILNTIYSLWFCNRIIYGNVKSHLLIKFKDLNFLEIFILSLLLFIVVLLGIFPNMIGGITLPLQHYSLLFVIKTLSVIHTMYL